MASESPALYQIEAQIRAALEAPLPGTEAHLSLAPHPRRGWRPGHVPPGASTAAGLLLLYPLYGRPHILLTVRAGELGAACRTGVVPGWQNRGRRDDPASRAPRGCRGGRGRRRSGAGPRCPVHTVHPGQRFCPPYRWLGSPTSVRHSMRRRAKSVGSSRSRSPTSSNRMVHTQAHRGDRTRSSTCRTTSCAGSACGARPP